jgi:hypothetical protein
MADPALDQKIEAETSIAPFTMDTGISSSGQPGSRPASVRRAMTVA